MKKTKVVALITLMLVAFCACGSPSSEAKDTGSKEPAVAEETKTEEDNSATLEVIDPTEEDESASKEETAPTNKESTEANKQEAAEEESSGIEVDKGLLNVTITLPASLFEDEETTFDPVEYNNENGFKETVVNEDGSVTVTMSKSKHKEILSDISNEIQNTCSEVIGGEDTPHIKDIIANKDYSEFTIMVDKEGYESAFDFTPLALGFASAMYQQFEGVEPYCEIIIKDVDTDEILENIAFPDDL